MRSQEWQIPPLLAWSPHVYHPSLSSRSSNRPHIPLLMRGWSAAGGPCLCFPVAAKPGTSRPVAPISSRDTYLAVTITLAKSAVADAASLRVALTSRVGGRPMLLPTTLVGSYAQPEWLIDRGKLAGRFPPRVRAKELWRIPEPYLAEAQDDATILAIKLQEEAGLDIITDGEIRRESYSNRFATAREGVDVDNPGTALDRSGHPNPVPRIVGEIRRCHPVEVEDLKFLRRHTNRMVKMTVPGPFTMSQQAQNDFYPSPAEAAFDYAEAVNEEIKTFLPPAPTSSRSTNPICRRGQSRRQTMASLHSIVRSKA